MALIYKIRFPDSLFITARNNELFEGTNSLFLGNNDKTYDINDFRNYNNPNPPNNEYLKIPLEDISSTDFKVSTKLEENKSKITYDFSLVGETAKLIIDYLDFIRFPGGSDTYPRPVEGLEYLYNTDKQIAIEVVDDCCPVGNSRTKTVIIGYIPLNSIRYCLEDGCQLSCTIYEDSARINAIRCIESTVLGVRSNAGVLKTAEISNDNISQTVYNTDTATTYATVRAKWFENCVEPTSPGTTIILASIIGYLKQVLLLPLILVFGVILTIVTVINTIIRAINVIPGINIPLISFGSDVTGNDPFTQASILIDQLFGIERIVEGLFGCKYVRGGYRVSSIIKAACSVCGFSSNGGTTTAQFRDGSTFPVINDDFTKVKIPVSYNPFVAFGNASTPNNDKLRDGFDTAYIPAEEAYKRRKEEKVLDNNIFSTSTEYLNSIRDVSIRAASIETLDKVFSRLGSLWGTGWDVVDVPVSENTPTGIQLQVGPLEGRYSFDKDTFVELEDADVCYELVEDNPIGYESSFQQDSADQSGNSQYKAYRGYISYANNNLKDRKPKKVKNFDVDFAPTNFIGSLKADTIYDEYRNNDRQLLGFPGVDDFFSEGILVTGSTAISVPKLVTFTIGGARVLAAGIACRVKDDNSLWTGANRMSDYVDTFVSSTTTQDDTNAILSAPFKPYPLPVGIQNLIPFYSIGYFGEGKTPPNIVSNEQLDYIASDIDNKYGSENFGYNTALGNIRRGGRSYAGPFNNFKNEQGKQVFTDSETYNFSPLMEFSIEKQNFKCGEEDLMNECVTSAVVKQTNNKLWETNDPAYKLRLVKLTKGLGVVTSLEIDYKNRNIKAEGYVIPFWQAGTDYFER